METLKKEIYNYIEANRASLGIEDEEAALKKFERILEEGKDIFVDEDYTEMVTAINNYILEGAVQKNKLLSYCVDYYDPTSQKSKVDVNGTEEVLHKFFHEEDLEKLFRFVKKHRDDASFSKTVYRIMEEYKMKPSMVYGGAMMSRQDFSRAMSVACKKVSRELVWQIIVGLKCSLSEADEVLFSAGYVRRKNAFDLTMEYFIEKGNYDIMAISDVLDSLGQKAFPCYKTVKDKDTTVDF